MHYPSKSRFIIDLACITPHAFISQTQAASARKHYSTQTCTGCLIPEESRGTFTENPFQTNPRTSRSLQRQTTMFNYLLGNTSTPD